MNTEFFQVEQKTPIIAQDDLRIYAIVRGDLNMTSGKMAAQAGHAYTNCALKAYVTNPELVSIYQGEDFIGTKICLVSKGADDLLKAYEKAKEDGLNTCLIVDSGHVIPGTAFDGNPIVTALGIGPCTKEQAKKITRKFKMAV